MLASAARSPPSASAGSTSISAPTTSFDAPPRRWNSAATDALIHPAQTRAKVWVENALRPLPAGTVLGFPVDLAAVEASGVLSAEGLRRAALEPTLPGLPIVGDVSLGELARARYGDEVTTRLIDPLLGGIAAGDLDRMSLDAIAALADKAEFEYLYDKPYEDKKPARSSPRHRTECSSSSKRSPRAWSTAVSASRRAPRSTRCRRPTALSSPLPRSPPHAFFAR